MPSVSGEGLFTTPSPDNVGLWIKETSVKPFSEQMFRKNKLFSTSKIDQEGLPTFNYRTIYNI